MENDTLDISWIDTHERENNINQNYYREPMSEITMKCIYINKHSEIEDVVSETYDVTSCGKENESVVTKEEILYFIQRKKQLDNSKYSLIDILIYCVDMEPEHIQNYAKNENNSEISEKFLRTHSIFNEIVLPDSIFIFHTVNAVYFIFKERKTHTGVKMRPFISDVIPKSILKREKTKKNGAIVSTKKHTKKVIFDDTSLVNDNNNNTRKNTNA
jgi:hypothetical protein